MSHAAERAKQWQTGLLRATAFYPDPFDLAGVNWWESLAGRPSESKNVRAGLGQLAEFGTVDDRVLQLQIQPGRIDWLLLPKDEPEGGSFPSLGDFEKCLGYFRELFFKWLSQAPELNRLAFGAQLYIPTADQSEAVQTVAGILQYVKIDWTGIRDIVFQLNRVQACKTLPELGAINRLVKWQTVVRKRIVGALLPEPQAPVTTAEEFAAYWELDISLAAPTDAKMKLPPEKLKELFTELTHEAADIVSRGDVL